MPQLLPTSEQDFERLITDGFVYVDKTEYIWKLVEMKIKDYAGRYKADSRQVIKIGADFSSQTRNIDDWKVSK